MILRRHVSLGEHLCRLSEAALPWWCFNAVMSVAMAAALAFAGWALGDAVVAAVGLAPLALLAVSVVAMRRCRTNIKSWREVEKMGGDR